MGIKFKCEHCQRTLNVKDHLGGKRGICPRCQGKIEIPLASTVIDGAGTVDSLAPPAPLTPQSSHVPLDPIAEAPQLNWYVAPPGSMTKYGPAQGDLMRSWIREGRVSGDSLVWREGWPQWRVAAQAFPELSQAPVNVVLPTPKAQPSSAPALPSAEVEDDIEEAFDGTIRPPHGVDIGVDDLDEPPPRAVAAIRTSAASPRDLIDSEPIPQVGAAAFAAIAPIDEDLAPQRRPSARTTASYPSARRESINAFLIAGLFVTFVALVAVLIYLLTSQ
ncbi:MAG TPA: DUF4339 domain-containing protein [Pirellulales bacterium]|jgi:hypothetical protein